MDSYDKAIEQWREQRPDLDVSPMALFGRAHIVGRLISNFYEESCRPFGLKASDFFLLCELRRSGKPYLLTPRELTNVLVRSSGGMTRQLDNLEKRGLISRVPDAIDRRSIGVQLTKDGLKLVDQALTAHVDNEAQALKGLSKKDLEALIENQKTLIEILRAASL